MKSENIEKLAKEMNVSVIDLMSLANSVVNSIKKDGIENNYLNETDENRNDIAKAYVIHSVKKIESFTTTYLTNPEAKKCFRENVLNLL